MSIIIKEDEAKAYILCYNYIGWFKQNTVERIQENMDITVMRYFIEVARVGNISRAAENLGITQPPLSRAINGIQKELGIQLFRRTAHGVELTQVGEQLYHALVNVVDYTESTLAQFNNIDRSIEGIIRIACVEDIMTTRLADTLNMFMDIHPNIKMSFVTGDPTYVRRLIKSDNADIAISNFTVEEEGLRYIDSGLKRRMGIVLPADNEHARASSVDIDWLKDKKLIAPKEDALRTVMGKELHGKYLEYDICATYDTPINYLDLIRNNDRYLICFELDHEKLKTHNLVFCPISPEVVINIGLIFSAKLKTGDIPLLLIEHIKKQMEINKRGHK